MTSDENLITYKANHWEEENGKRYNERNSTEKLNFVLIPYAELDKSCSTCTQEKIISAVQKKFISLVNYFKNLE